MKFNYLIIAGGKLPPVFFIKKCLRNSSQLVLVDRGADILKKLGKLKPFLFVGDGDSSKIFKSRGEKFIAKKTILLPANKNISDLEFALKLLPRNSSKLVLGAHEDHEGRHDHLFSNFILASRFKSLILADEKNWIVGLKNSSLSFKTKSKTLFSVIAPSTAKVTIKNATFNLTNEKLLSPTHGLSNLTLAGKPASIRVQGDALLFAHVSILNTKIEL